MENVDEDMTKWTEQKKTLLEFKESNNYNEIFFRRKEISIYKEEMRRYIK